MIEWIKIEEIRDLPSHKNILLYDSIRPNEPIVVKYESLDKPHPDCFAHHVIKAFNNLTDLKINFYIDDRYTHFAFFNEPENKEENPTDIKWKKISSAKELPKDKYIMMVRPELLFMPTIMEWDSTCNAGINTYGKVIPETELFINRTHGRRPIYFDQGIDGNFSHWTIFNYPS